MGPDVPATVSSSDRPLTDPADDRLALAPFAKQLASSVLASSPADGLVVALYGEWGSGKSTVLNFIEHYLTQLDDAPLVVRFNPWWFAGKEELIRRFFAEFEAAVTKSGRLEKQATTRFLGGLLGRFGELVSKGGDAAAALTSGAAVMHGVPANESAAAGASVKAAATIVGAAADAGSAKFKPTGVVEIKDALAKALGAELSRIVVIIDDIDRLVPAEVREVFRLVKAVGDLPNVTYLLAFDRTLTAAAMTEVHGSLGDEYLEKIVQVPFTLPMPERGRLQRILLENLETLVGEVPDDLFNEQEWANVFIDGIDPFIRKPRDIVRLCNSLRATYPAVRGEVRPADFIALEVLRVFAPMAYDVVRTNPSRFAGIGEDGYSDKEAAEAAKVFHNEWLSKVGPNEGHVRKLVRRLFPRIGGVFGNISYGSSSLQEWRRFLRVCSPEVFPVYFRFGLATGEVSALEVRQMLASSGDVDAMTDLFRSLMATKRDDGRTKASEMLLRLNDHGKEVPLENIGSVVRVLFRVGDEIVASDTHRRSMFDLGDEYRITWLMRKLLKRLPLDRRAGVLRAAIMLDDTATATIVREVVRYAQQHEPGEAPRDPEDIIVRAEDSPDLKELALTRIRMVAASNDFWSRPRVRTLLDALVLIGDEQLARGLVRKRIESDDGLFSLLQLFAGTLHISTVGDHGARRVLTIDPAELAGLVDSVDALEERVTAYLASGTASQEYKDLAGC